MSQDGTIALQPGQLEQDSVSKKKRKEKTNNKEKKTMSIFLLWDGEYYFSTKNERELSKFFLVIY